MESLAQLHRHRRSTNHQRMRLDPSTYLNRARLRLLDDLPTNHRLYSRATRSGRLKPQDSLPTDMPRVPFTEEELAQIRLRRRYTADPDDVRYQLQDSKLVQMWNADYDREEQWKEYDEAKATMEMKKEISGLPDAQFQSDEVVLGKRRRIVPEQDSIPVRKMVADSKVVEESNLEEGEIKEEVAVHVGEVEGREDDQLTFESLRALEKANERLKAENEAMKVVASTLPEYILPASPVSEKTDSSGDESDDSMKVEHEFFLGDFEDGTFREGYDSEISIHSDRMDELFRDLRPTPEGTKERQPIGEQKTESQAARELG